MNNLYLYFSGTGNTKYVIEKFSKLYEKDKEYKITSIENKDLNFNSLINEANKVIIAYPIYESMMPCIMIEFLKDHLTSFVNKKIIVISTQMLFSGDGAALAYRLLKKVNIKLLHTIHINMPNNITDLSIFKSKPLEETNKILEKADKKIEVVIDKINNGKKLRDGRAFYSWFSGFFTQRLWGLLFLKKMRSAVKIDDDKCILCNKCVKTCPTENIYIENNKIKVMDKCTLCYRCVNSCPKKAISIFSKKKPKIQYIRKDYN